MVELSKSQDIEAGDGTTSVVVLAGALLNACSTLLSRGIHPNQISDAFQLASRKAEEIMTEMAVPVDFNDRATLVKCTTTSLSSKVNIFFSEPTKLVSDQIHLKRLSLKTLDSSLLLLLML